MGDLQGATLNAFCVQFTDCNCNTVESGAKSKVNFMLLAAVWEINVTPMSVSNTDSVDNTVSCDAFEKYTVCLVRNK